MWLFKEKWCELDLQSEWSHGEGSASVVTKLIRSSRGLDRQSSVKICVKIIDKKLKGIYVVIWKPLAEESMEADLIIPFERILNHYLKKNMSRVMGKVQGNETRH